MAFSEKKYSKKASERRKVHAEGARIFVAAPISAFSDQNEYNHFRKLVLDFCDLIEKDSRVSSVYCAARNISSAADFSGSSDALLIDLKNLLESDAFVMFYPKKIVSSVTVEAGVALGKHKPMLFFVNDAGDLPYLLRAANSHDENSIVPPIRIAKLDGNSLVSIFGTWVDTADFSDMFLAAE